MSTQTHPQTSPQASSPTGTALPALQGRDLVWGATRGRSEEHTSELQSQY